MSHTNRSSHTADKIIDLNDLRIFAYVSSLTSFTLAADALQIHKSSVSRSVARLEVMLETPLLERPTRKVLLTQRGAALKERCIEMLSCVNETIGLVPSASARSEPRPAAAPSAPAMPARLSTMVPAKRQPLRAQAGLQGRMGAGASRTRRQDVSRLGAAA